MSVTDFLFEGQPPKSVTTYGETIKDMPKWLSDYTQGLISRANAVASEPYQPYKGPRIAGFTQDQKNAFDTTRQNIGNYEPGMEAAAYAAQEAGEVSPLTQAQPYMQQAGRSFTDSYQDYMDPYVGNVIDRAELEANRNFTEKLMPSIDSKYTSAGQYGSAAALREANRGARDITEGLQSQSLAALSGAFGQAGTLFNQDANRQGALAATAGNLATSEGQLKLGASQQQGALAQAMQSMGLKDSAALDAIGSAQQSQQQKNLDLAYKDFTDQRDHPRDTIDWMSSVVRGLPAPSSERTTSTGPSAVSGPSGLAQLASLGTAIAGWNESQKNARGGQVRRYSNGGRVARRRAGV